MATTATSATGSAAAPRPGGNNKTVSTGRWTEEEHRFFLQLMNQHGNNWKKISSILKSRTALQVRSHAQKHLQKLARALEKKKKKSEEGGGGGGKGAKIPLKKGGRSSETTAVSSETTAVQSSSAMTQSGCKHQSEQTSSGTKRKAIPSAAPSTLQNEGKKMGSSATNIEDTNQRPQQTPQQAPPLPTVSPEQPRPSNSTMTTQGPIFSGPALEDSLFRFLSPVVIPSNESTHNINTKIPDLQAGVASPQGIAELRLYPSWTVAYSKDTTPSWYATTTGSDDDDDDDAVADSLDWLNDPGDLHESYQPAKRVAHNCTHHHHQNKRRRRSHHEKSSSTPPKATKKKIGGLVAQAKARSVNNKSRNTLPESNSPVEEASPSSLPSYEPDFEDPLVRHSVTSAIIEEVIDEQLGATFDSLLLEEHGDLVSNILENNACQNTG